MVESQEKYSNPFAAVDIVKEATEEAKVNLFAEAKDMLGAAHDIHKAAKSAKKRGDVTRLGRLKLLAQDLMGIAMEFIRQAVVISIAKFVLELCALIINSIMDAISARIGNKNLEISTPNVFFNRGTAPQATSSYPPSGTQVGRDQWARPTTASDYANPFAGVFSGSGASSL